MNQKLSLSLNFVGALLLLLASVFPHHHHGQEVFADAETCEHEAAAGDHPTNCLQSVSFVAPQTHDDICPFHLLSFAVEPFLTSLVPPAICTPVTTMPAGTPVTLQSRSASLPCGLRAPPAVLS